MGLDWERPGRPLRIGIRMGFGTRIRNEDQNKDRIRSGLGTRIRMVLRIRNRIGIRNRIEKDLALPVSMLGLTLNRRR